MLPKCSSYSSSSLPSIIRANAARSTKWYCTPSCSPGRGGRVVHDTDTHTCGYISRTAATTVPFPTPDGPESTVRRLDTLDTRKTYRAAPGRVAAAAQLRLCL